MQWLGLSALGLTLSLVGFGSAIVALYLLKQEQRRIVVPAIALWEALLAKRETATLWTRLRRLFSLLVALAVVALVVFSLADIRRALGDSGRNLVLLIDHSASMAATDAQPTRLDAAKVAARSFVRTLAPEDRAIVVALDGAATPLSTLTDDRVPLLSAIDDVVQTDLAGDLEAGVRFALDVLDTLAKPELVVFSDGNLRGIERAAALLEKKAVHTRYVRIGESARNLAITNFSVRRYPLDKTHHESIIALKNFGEREEKLELTLTADGAPIHQETLTLGPRAELTRALTDLSGADSSLEARIRPLKGADALATDNRAYATLPPRRRSRVLVVTDGNRYLEAALLLDEYLDVTELLPGAYRDGSGFDVVIFDRTLPAKMPSVPALYLALPSAPGVSPVLVDGEVARPYFERIDREHPLMRFTALGDVNVARAVRVKPDAKDRVIAATAERVPLVLEGTREDIGFVALTFDVRESDLPLRPAWPLLVLGAVDLLAGEAGAALDKNLAGDLFTADLPLGVERAELVSASGTREPITVRDGRVRVVSDRAGLFELVAGDLRAKIAVNVPADEEGSIAPRAHMLARAEAPLFESAGAGLLGERLWPLLAVLALSLLGIEWLTFHRRWTV